MKILIEAIDGEWPMGEDLEIEVEESTTIFEIKELIKQHRGCPISRQRIDAEPKETHHGTLDECPVKKLGLKEGDSLTVHPTRHNAFLWHPLEYYERKLLDLVHEYLKERDGGPVDLVELTTDDRFKPPPPLRYKLKVYLRKFPDEFYLEYDFKARIFTVSLNPEFKPPLIF
mmetsp:Transcript_21094/g.27705  ORF Transcript_21094/g.27705 Transcript_21094/m.27705 type:complete len:172 (+) Transcript_21094:66-581(+)